MGTDSAPWASYLPPTRTDALGMQVSCTASFGTDTSCSYADWLEQKAHQWIADHPAETVALLVENGVLEEAGWGYATADHIDGRFHLCRDEPTAHRYREPIYRVSLPTKGDQTDG